MEAQTFEKIMEKHLRPYIDLDPEDMPDLPSEAFGVTGKIAAAAEMAEACTAELAARDVQLAQAQTTLESAKDELKSLSTEDLMNDAPKVARIHLLVFATIDQALSKIPAGRRALWHGIVGWEDDPDGLGRPCVTIPQSLRESLSFALAHHELHEGRYRLVALTIHEAMSEPTGSETEQNATRNS